MNQNTRKKIRKSKSEFFLHLLLIFSELSTFFNSFHQHPKNTLIKRALDMLEGDDFIGMQKRKRALDLMEGDGFGGGFDRKRRALDMMEGDDFIGLKKRSNMLRKRALDILEGDDFVGMQKR